MNDFDGNAFEMPEHRPVDDGMIEAALAGTTRGETLDALSSFVSGVRSAVQAAPAPSPAMAAVLAAGFSTEKGDLPATAASNVNGPAPQASGLSKWGKTKMKIQGFLAGLGVAGKIALGVGVAAAATTGAGASGMLPFSLPGISHPHHHAALAVATTTTQAPAPAVSAQPHTKHVRHKRVHPAAPAHANTNGGTATSTTTVTTTTGSEPGTTPTTDTTPTTETPTTVGVPPTTTAPTPTTTPSGLPIQLSCASTGATQVTCTWSGAPTPVAKYALWRWTTGGNGSDYAPIYESPDGLTFVDNSVTAGVPYTYRVFTTLGDGTQGPVSNRFYFT